MSHAPLRLFALNSSRELGHRIGERLGLPLAEHEEREFDDGEHKSRPLTSVRGKDVFVVQSLYGDPQQSVNDKLCRLLFFIGALKDAAAARVTAVIPYLCYARKDRKTQTRDPVTTRYVAALLESVGTDHVVTLDVHNVAAFQNAFRCSTDHLEARGLFVDHFAQHLGEEPLVVVSPDVGGIKRAERFREALGRRLGRPVEGAFMEKRRVAGAVSGETIAGDVRDRVAIIVDDLISTGATIGLAVAACERHGARSIHAVATHGVFVGQASRALSTPALKSLVVTDTIPPFRLDPALGREKLVVLDAAALFGEAIRRIHVGDSVTALLQV